MRPVDILIKKLQDFDAKYPEALQPEMLDVLSIVEMGGKKHGFNGYLEPNGAKMSRKENHDSMGHHWAQSAVEDRCSRDKESHKHPLLHLMCRSMMGYIRDVRNLRSDKDPKRYHTYVGRREDHLGESCITMEQHFENAAKQKSQYVDRKKDA